MEMIKQLSDLSNKKKQIVIAYYDHSDNIRDGRMFREVVQESWIRQQDLKKLAQERSTLIDSLRGNPSMRNVFRMADSIVCEKYFTLYRDNEREAFSKRIEKILIPFHDGTKNEHPIFRNIDNIKNNYLTMSCWSNGGKALFTFPGKFAADEIGFISIDRDILNYINTMLDGVENDNK